jgi:hypothetical protein
MRGESEEKSSASMNVEGDGERIVEDGTSRQRKYGSMPWTTEEDDEEEEELTCSNNHSMEASRSLLKRRSACTERRKVNPIEVSCETRAGGEGERIEKRPRVFEARGTNGRLCSGSYTDTGVEGVGGGRSDMQ